LRQSECNQLDGKGIIENMAVIHISEADAVRDFSSLLAQVRAGAEIMIESGTKTVAVLKAPAEESHFRTISESISIAKNHAKKLGYEPRMSADFAADIEEVIKNRKPWNPPAWD